MLALLPCMGCAQSQTNNNVIRFCALTQSCSCNQAVISSADIIDWDEGSINCGGIPTFEASVLMFA